MKKWSTLNLLLLRDMRLPNIDVKKKSRGEPSKINIESRRRKRPTKRSTLDNILRTTLPESERRPLDNFLQWEFWHPLRRRLWSKRYCPGSWVKSSSFSRRTRRPLRALSVWFKMVFLMLKMSTMQLSKPNTRELNKLNLPKSKLRSRRISVGNRESINVRNERRIRL